MSASKYFKNQEIHAKRVCRQVLQKTLKEFLMTDYKWYKNAPNVCNSQNPKALSKHKKFLAKTLETALMIQILLNYL